MDVTEQRARQIIQTINVDNGRAKRQTGLSSDPHLHRVPRIESFFSSLGRRGSRQCRLKPSKETVSKEGWRPCQGGGCIVSRGLKQRNPSFHGTVYRSGAALIDFPGLEQCLDDIRVRPPNIDPTWKIPLDWNNSVEHVGEDFQSSSRFDEFWEMSRVVQRVQCCASCEEILSKKSGV